MITLIKYIKYYLEQQLTSVKENLHPAKAKQDTQTEEEDQKLHEQFYYIIHLNTGC